MNKVVTIYTRQGCIHCTRIKEWMSQNNLDFEEVNIYSMEDSDLRNKINGVPYTIIRSEEVVVGFNADKLRSILIE